MVTEGSKKGQMTKNKQKLVIKVEKQLNMTGFQWIPMDSPDSVGFPQIPWDSADSHK
jgi:hypothetical protein